jgi:tetratricopeptide (TPR) repeat protein
MGPAGRISPARTLTYWCAVALLAGLGLTGPQAAVAVALPGAGTVEDVDTSIVDRIFSENFPALNGRNASTILNSTGLDCTYYIAELGTRDDRTWDYDGRSFTQRSTTEQMRNLPTIENAKELLALSGLDMAEILQFDALSKAGDRAAMLALLTKYIEPDMDKYNRKDVEGYDPALCLNPSRDRVYRLDITDAKLTEIRNCARLFAAGRYADYRKKIEGYLAAYPHLSLLHVAMGNACFAEGDLDGAERWYRQGASANPLNPMLGYSMAFCHLARGGAARAVEALTGAVMMCRNNLLAWLALDCLLPGQGGQIVDHRFKNRTLVAAESARIAVDKGQTQKVLEPWLWYAAAEIVTEHSRSRTAHGFDTWDLEAIETYKIAHLLGVYMQQKSVDPTAYDPDLDTLQDIYESGFLRQYIIYDRIAPYGQYFRVAVLPEPEKAKMRQYVDRYVVRLNVRGGAPGPTR